MRPRPRIELDPHELSAPGVVQVTVHGLRPDVTSVSGRFEHAAPKLYFSCKKVDRMTWSGAVVAPPHSAKGLWKLTTLQILDKGNNIKLYHEGDPEIGNIGFTIR